MVAHACNPSTLGSRSRRISEFKASLVYRVSFRIARATQRNPNSEKNKNKNKQTNKQKTKIQAMPHGWEVVHVSIVGLE